jgi:hypothetical protein
MIGRVALERAPPHGTALCLNSEAGPITKEVFPMVGRELNGLLDANGVFRLKPHEELQYESLA